MKFRGSRLAPWPGSAKAVKADPWDGKARFESTKDLSIFLLFF